MSTSACRGLNSFNYIPLPCVTACHHSSIGLYRSLSEQRLSESTVVTATWVKKIHWSISAYRGPGSSVDIATDSGLDGSGSNPGGDEISRTCPDRPWGPPSLLYNGYRVFPGGKVRPGRAADHSSPSSVAVMEE